jgi:YD repeat-containing protein
MRKNNGTIATFEYDALGRRIETVDAIAGTTTRYTYDVQRAAVQTRVSGSVEFRSARPPTPDYSRAYLTAWA